MDRDTIRIHIQGHLAELLDDPSVALTDGTTAADVPGWDSIVHLKLMLALEEGFEIAFAVNEIKAPSNVGDLVDMVGAKL